MLMLSPGYSRSLVNANDRKILGRPSEHLQSPFISNVWDRLGGFYLRHPYPHLPLILILRAGRSGSTPAEHTILVAKSDLNATRGVQTYPIDWFAPKLGPAKTNRQISWSGIPPISSGTFIHYRRTRKIGGVSTHNKMRVVVWEECGATWPARIHKKNKKLTNVAYVWAVLFHNSLVGDICYQGTW